MKNSIHNSGTVTISEDNKLLLSRLSKPNNFIEDRGLLRRKNSIYDSGRLLKYTITNFKRLPKRGDTIYRGKCDLIVQTEGTNDIVFSCTISSLLMYKIITNPDKYLDITFESFNTTPEYTCNPLRLIKSVDGKYILYSVSEKGHENYNCVIPGGEVIVKQRFTYFKAEYYTRYYEAKQK